MTNWAFSPAFPLSAYPMRHWLKLSPSASMVIASKIALLLAIYAFLLMVKHDGDSVADLVRAGALVAFNPYLIYGHAGYAEPLYFALFALAYYLAVKRRWILAGILGAILSATRIVGFLFAIVYLGEWLRSCNWRPLLRKEDLNKLIGLMLCPLGMALYMLYLYHWTGDAFAQLHVQAAWARFVENPLLVLMVCLRGKQWLQFGALTAIAGLLASVFLLKLRKPELGVYLALSILIPLAGGISGMARYLWWQPPFLYVAYAGVRGRAAAWAIYLAFAGGFASIMILSWFSGHYFVI